MQVAELAKRREDQLIFNEQIKSLLKKIEFMNLKIIDENHATTLIKDIEKVGYFIQEQLKHLGTAIFLDTATFNESYALACNLQGYMRDLATMCFLKHEHFKDNAKYNQMLEIVEREKDEDTHGQ